MYELLVSVVIPYTTHVKCVSFGPHSRNTLVVSIPYITWLNPVLVIDLTRGVASRLATNIYVAIVIPILYDNSYSPNNSNLKINMKVIGFMVDF